MSRGASRGALGFQSVGKEFTQMTSTNIEPAPPAQDDQSLPTGVQLTPLDAAFRENPYPLLEELREQDPVHHDAVLNRYVVTRHDDVDALLRDRTLMVNPRHAASGTLMQMFSERQSEGEEFEPSMLFEDPPRHTRLRGLVNKAFTPRALEKMTPRIREIVDELLDAVAEKESFDLIGEFSSPLPIIVIAEMLGVDPGDRADFKRWSDDSILGFNPFLGDEDRARMVASDHEFSEYLGRIIAERRESPRDDMFSGLVLAEEEGDQLSDNEVASMVALLLVAGNVTTTDLIGNGVLALLQHPDQLARLREDPSLIQNAVEEMLRYDTPVMNTGRIPVEPANVGGCPIGAGQSIMPSLAAANRDPSVYPDPDRFDITRQDTHHHSFGGGVHYCLGAPLARLEAQIGIGRLVERFPGLRLAEQILEWKSIPAFRGLARLIVLP
jgi:cytochrome P450